MLKIAAIELEKLLATDGYPMTLGELQTIFPVRNLARKARVLVDSGMLVRLKRNLFAASPRVIGRSLDLHMLANRICTPSYVSRESALSYFGMIPEMVVNVTSSRLGRTMSFSTGLGTFFYEQVEKSVYPIGLRSETTGRGAFLCAGPEKALYDLFQNRENLQIRSVLGMRQFLFEDLRLDVMDKEFDASVFDELIAVGRKRRMIELAREVLCHA